MNRKIAFWMGLYFALCFFAQVWPVASLANRIEPFVLGLPFFFFWYVAWALVIFLGFLITYLWEKKSAGT